MTFGLTLLHVFIGEAELGHHAGSKSFDDDVALRCHLLCDFKRFRLFHVEGDGALAPVERDGMRAMVAVEGTHRTAPIAIERIDLDHVRAVLRQQHRAVGARDALCEI